MSSTSRITRTQPHKPRQPRRPSLKSTPALLLATLLALAGCGGSDGGDSDEGGPETTLAGQVEGGGSEAVEGDVSDSTGTRPTTIAFGESYTLMVDETAAPLSISIPAGSVTVASLEGSATNAGAVSVGSQDGSLRFSVEAGGTVESDVLITANEEGLDLLLDVTGVAGDTITLTIKNELQTESADGGDAPAIITDAPAITESVAGLLGGPDQEDVLEFTAAAGDVITVDLSVPGDSEGQVNVLWEFNGSEQARASATAGGAESASVVLNSEQGGSWYLRVWGSGAYNLDVAAVSQNEAGSGNDAGADIATAVAATPGVISGQLGNQDDGDFYAVELPAGAVVTLDLSVAADAPGAINVRLLENGSEVSRVSASPGGSESIEMTLASGASTGHLEVWGADSAYEITFAVGQQADGGGIGDAGEDAAQAAVIEAPGTFTGTMSADDTADFYSFVSDGTVNVTMTAEGADPGYNFRLLVGGSEVERSTAGPGAPGTIDVEIPAGETVILELWSGRGAYEFVIE